jgi:hypothetical protein
MLFVIFHPMRRRELILGVGVMIKGVEFRVSELGWRRSSDGQRADLTYTPSRPCVTGKAGRFGQSTF